jgi:hypothetical protein
VQHRHTAWGPHARDAVFHCPAHSTTPDFIRLDKDIAYRGPGFCTCFVRSYLFPANAKTAMYAGSADSTVRTCAATTRCVQSAGFASLCEQYLTGLGGEAPEDAALNSRRQDYYSGCDSTHLRHWYERARGRTTNEASVSADGKPRLPRQANG